MDSFNFLLTEVSLELLGNSFYDINGHKQDSLNKLVSKSSQSETTNADASTENDLLKVLGIDGLSEQQQFDTSSEIENYIDSIQLNAEQKKDFYLGWYFVHILSLWKEFHWFAIFLSFGNLLACRNETTESKFDRKVSSISGKTESQQSRIVEFIFGIWKTKSSQEPKFINGIFHLLKSTEWRRSVSDKREWNADNSKSLPYTILPMRKTNVIYHKRNERKKNRNEIKI